MCYTNSMMKVILSVVFVLAQAAAPVPREATHQASPKSDKVKTASDPNAEETAKSVLNKDSAKPNEPKKDTEAQTKHNKQESETIRVAPVDVHKDWADYLYIATNLLLTLATFAIAIYAAVQARAAKQSANAYEQTVRLTERADVLLEAAGFTNPVPGHFDGKSSAIFRFKNFGRTRANTVLMDVNLVVPGVPDTPSPALPQIAIGAGETQTLTFQSFFQTLTQDTFRGICDGSIKLSFVGEIKYEDVFRVAHIVECSGEFHRQTRSFICTKNSERNPN